MSILVVKEEERMVSVDVGAFMSRVERLYSDWEVQKGLVHLLLYIFHFYSSN